MDRTQTKTDEINADELRSFRAEEKLGYASLPIPIEARDLGALHRRARVFLVAHSLGRRALNAAGGAADADGRAERAQSGFPEMASAQAARGASRRGSEAAADADCFG